MQVIFFTHTQTSTTNLLSSHHILAFSVRVTTTSDQNKNIYTWATRKDILFYSNHPCPSLTPPNPNGGTGSKKNSHLIICFNFQAHHPIPTISMLMFFGAVEAFKKNNHFCLCVVVWSISIIIVLKDIFVCRNKCFEFTCHFGLKGFLESYPPATRFTPHL